MPAVHSLAHQCYAVTRDLLHARAGRDRLMLRHEEGGQSWQKN